MRTSMQEAQPLVSDVIGRGGSFEGLLRQWVANDCHLSGNSAAVMTQACLLCLQVDHACMLCALASVPVAHTQCTPCTLCRSASACWAQLGRSPAHLYVYVCVCNVCRGAPTSSACLHA